MADVTVLAPVFLDAPHTHAHMLRIDDDGDALRLQDVHDDVCDFRGQAFLQLGLFETQSTTRASLLRPVIFPVFRDIGHMNDAKKGRK
jgi:hypothetical protein